MKRIYVKPREGLLIRDEYSLAHIPPEGCEVALTRYVQRRLNDGGLIEAPAPAPARKSKSADGEG